MEGGDCMSSFNFRKLKQPDLKHYIRHCDRKARLKDEHANIHINKSLTNKNAQLKRSYEETCKLFDDTLADLDRRPKANHRIDRVVTYAIEGPLPIPVDNEKDKEKAYQWIQGVVNILKKKYPSVVVLQWYMHRDEQHEYLNPDTGEYVMSRQHVHIFVMPIVDEKLNSKKFFPNKKAFYDFNARVDELTISIFGVPYSDGSKKKGFSTTEELKIASEKAEYEARRKAAQEAEKDLINREVALKQLEDIIEEREQDVNRREVKMMAFLNSEIGKKAMQEYNASVQRNTATPARGKKQGGKISFVREQEMEVK